jgi:uncharacterized protein RhaS with RHS repeats
VYYYRARYCHPTLQRFISEDPIGFAGGDFNLYGYVTNNPLSFSDPLGLDKKAPGEACSLGLPSLPPGEDLNKNIALARRHRLSLLNPIGSAVNLVWFAAQVNPPLGRFPHGPWDYKRGGPLSPGPNPGSPFENGGNFNYGATGRALGIPAAVLHRTAGLVQQRTGPYDPRNGVWYGTYPHGDEPRDQDMIGAGIDYAERCSR